MISLLEILKKAGKIIGKCFCYPFQKHQATYNIVIASVTTLTLVWGAMTYQLLEQRERARTELFEIKERIKNSESTTVTINTKFEESMEDGQYYIFPTVTIKNIGKEKLILRLDDDSLNISLIKMRGEQAISLENYRPNFFEEISDDINKNSKRFSVMEVPVDGERSIPYAVKVNNKGLYYVTFSAKPFLKENERKVGSHELIWFTSSYMYIK